jgi:hypothetical protein
MIRRREAAPYAPFELVSRDPLVLVSGEWRAPAWLLLLIEVLCYIGVPFGMAALINDLAGTIALAVVPVVPMVMRMGLALHSSHDQLVTRVRRLEIRPREDEGYRSSAGRMLLVVDERELDADEVERVVVTKEDRRPAEGDDEVETVEVFKLYLVLRQLVVWLHESTLLKPTIQLAGLLQEKLLRSTDAVEVVEEKDPVDVQQMTVVILPMILGLLGFAGLAAVLDLTLFRDRGLGPLLVAGCGVALLLLVRVVALLYARSRHRFVARFLAANFRASTGASPRG